MLVLSVTKIISLCFAKNPGTIVATMDNENYLWKKTDV